MPLSGIEEAAVRYKHVALAASITSILALLGTGFFESTIFLLSSAFVAAILLSNRLAKERPRLVFVVHALAILLMAFVYHRFSVGDERFMGLMNVLAGSVFSFCLYGFLKSRQR